MYESVHLSAVWHRGFSRSDAHRTLPTAIAFWHGTNHLCRALASSNRSPIATSDGLLLALRQTSQRCAHMQPSIIAGLLGQHHLVGAHKRHARLKTQQSEQIAHERVVR